ncbi:MAG: hypothetical protein ACRD1N_05215 [Terriglobia bacterium]
MQKHIGCLSSYLAVTCLVAAAALTPPTDFAQSTFATITGTVSDVSGAVVPNAKVTGPSFGTISGVGGVNGGSTGDEPGARALQAMFRLEW